MNVRIIVASNEKLNIDAEQGKFREDLYHRLNEFQITLPALRERKDDILAFAHFFIRQASAALKKPVKALSPEAEQAFLEYSWPGNLREMHNSIKRACLLAEGGEIRPADFPAQLRKVSDTRHMAGIDTAIQERNVVARLDLRSATIRAEYNRITQVLKEVNFNKAKAARILNIDRKTLYNKINSYFTILSKLT